MGLTQIRGTQVLDNDLTFDDIGDGAVRGATANGGLQRELATGTVSDVDIRNSAITPLKIDSTQGFSMASLSLLNTSNQLVLGTTTTVTLTAPTPVANRIITIPDVGGSASVVMTEGTQTINGSKTFSSRVTLAVAGHNDIHWDWNMYSLDNNDQYGMFLSGSDVQLRAAANATLDISASTATIQPFSSPSWLFNSSGLSTSTGRLYIADGTVGAPSFSFNSESATGMYRIAANTLGLATSGIEAVRIDSSQNVGIGGAPVTSGILTLTSTSKAFVPPRMTQAQRDAISTPSAGMVVYNTDTNLLNVYNGSTWVPVGSNSFPLLAPDGSSTTPEYSFTNNSNMGMYRVGASTLGFTTGGTLAIQIDGGQAVDFLQHQAKQLVVHVLGSDPVSPVEGQIWYNTTTHQWVGYNGTSNVVLG